MDKKYAVIDQCPKVIGECMPLEYCHI